MTYNVALVVGSLRKESFTRKVGHALMELAPDSLHFETVAIGDLPLYNQDLETGQPPTPWVAFRERVRPLAGVLFATPEYNRSVPGVLKNAIDVGSRPYGKSAWAHKPAAIVSVSPGRVGAFGANHHLRQSLVFLDMPCMQQPELYVGEANKLFDGDRLVNDTMRAQFKAFVHAFAHWVERFAHDRAASSAA